MGPAARCKQRRDVGGRNHGSARQKVQHVRAIHLLSAERSRLLVGRAGDTVAPRYALSYSLRTLCILQRRRPQNTESSKATSTRCSLRLETAHGAKNCAPAPPECLALTAVSNRCSPTLVSPLNFAEVGTLGAAFCILRHKKKTEDHQGTAEQIELLAEHAEKGCFSPPKELHHLLVCNEGSPRPAWRGIHRFGQRNGAGGVALDRAAVDPSLWTEVRSRRRRFGPRCGGSIALDRGAVQEASLWTAARYC